MLKPESLRRHLESSSAWVAAHPDRVLTFIDAGNIIGTATASESFEYRYTLNLVFVDFDGHADTLVVPVLAWLRTHQPEMLLNPALMAEGFAFEADILNNTTMDLSIKLLLTERVIVRILDGQLTAEHIAEPAIDPYAGVVDTWELIYIKPETTPGWTVPIPTPT